MPSLVSYSIVVVVSSTKVLQNVLFIPAYGVFTLTKSTESETDRWNWIQYQMASASVFTQCVQFCALLCHPIFSESVSGSVSASVNTKLNLQPNLSISDAIYFRYFIISIPFLAWKSSSTKLSTTDMTTTWRNQHCIVVIHD